MNLEDKTGEELVEIYRSYGYTVDNWERIKELRWAKELLIEGIQIFEKWKQLDQKSQ